MILTISLTGSMPDFSALYHNLGFDVLNTGTMRKALASIKSRAPSVIVAEFVYAPTYGSQLSNFESLLAAIETCTTDCKLIAMVFPDDITHCKHVLNQFKNCEIMTFPVARDRLQVILEKYAQN